MDPGIYSYNNDNRNIPSPFHTDQCHRLYNYYGFSGINPHL